MILMRIIAHRGASKLTPENTLMSFGIAIREGVYGIETDVQVTRDGEGVLFHDRKLSRTTNGHGRIDEVPIEYVRSLDAGLGQQVPLLHEGLSFMKEESAGKIHVYLELKETVYRHLNAVLGEVVKLNMLGNVTFISFHHDMLNSLIDADPSAHVGYLHYLHISMHSGRLAVVNHRLLTERKMQLARSKGMGILAYTVDRQDRIRRLSEIGVDGVITNDVLAAKAALRH
ncbi:hypothetical protein M1590_03315 [Candidatus Marsarchaeota archaeon]|nr:hypothetical protein [Candidatus Marsarchaeota archaeon]